MKKVIFLFVFGLLLGLGQTMATEPIVGNDYLTETTDDFRFGQVYVDFMVKDNIVFTPDIVHLSSDQILKLNKSGDYILMVSNTSNECPPEDCIQLDSGCFCGIPPDKRDDE